MNNTKSKNPQVQQPQIDLSATQPVLSEDGNMVFQYGYILRKVSKFLTNTAEDSIAPIPVMFDPKTGKIMVSEALGLPKELHDELVKYNESLDGK